MQFHSIDTCLRCFEKGAGAFIVYVGNSGFPESLLFLDSDKQLINNASEWPSGKASGLVATYLFRTCSSPARDELKRNLSECMRFGCRLPIAVISEAYPGNSEI